jgi:hypothetical protein
LKEPPSKNVPLILGASGLTARLEDALRGPDPDVLLRRIRALERFESLYLPKTPPHLRGDQINLALKGVEFDFLIRGTVDALYQIVRATPGLLPEDLAEIGAGWKTATFPSTPAIPDGDVDGDTFAALEASFKALQQTMTSENAKRDGGLNAIDRGEQL